MRNLVKRFFSGFLSLMMVVALLSSMSLVAFAEPIDKDEVGDTASFKATYLINDKAQSGVNFRVYKIGDYRGGALFTWTEEFSKYDITIPDFSSVSEVTALRETLAGYIARDNVTPLATLTTDADGKMSLESLDLGMYIVLGDSTATWDYIYKPVPFIVFAPFTTEEDTIGYDIDVEVKVTETPVEITYVDRHVIKVWEDSGYSGRPTNVTVQLLRDGAVFDTVTLSAENNWRHTWDRLDSRYNWSCVENAAPSGYTTSVSLQGLTYTITNTRPYNPPTVPTIPTLPPPLVDIDNPSIIIPDDVPILSEYPFEPEDPEEPPEEPSVPVEPEEPSTPVEPSEPVEPSDPPVENIPDPDVPKSDNIPQTGQLLWPIPFLGVAGALFIIVGLVSGKKERD